ncbi:hypothetical protein Ciccas_005938 [Cichlidogyrus casuarinus]|uniref:Uncharacterized protein n=1 Tax=Cichlidogyrus casuarinus TaxID=1844966 RepID=A0ABD2Q789_9PLAT
MILKHSLEVSGQKLIMLRPVRCHKTIPAKRVSHDNVLDNVQWTWVAISTVNYSQPSPYVASVSCLAPICTPQVAKRFHILSQDCPDAKAFSSFRI